MSNYEAIIDNMPNLSIDELNVLAGQLEIDPFGSGPDAEDEEEFRVRFAGVLHDRIGQHERALERLNAVVRGEGSSERVDDMLANVLKLVSTMPESAPIAPEGDKLIEPFHTIVRSVLTVVDAELNKLEAITMHRIGMSGAVVIEAATGKAMEGMNAILMNAIGKANQPPSP